MIILGHEIYVSKPLTSHKIMELLDKHPELKKITCPPSLYKRIAPRYLNALYQLGIEVEPVEKMGRPRKYGKKEIETMEKMFKDGLTPREISDALDIPLKTVYHYNRKPLKKGVKCKYSLETVQKIKTMHKKGLSAKEISFKLDIPLRSVYSLLKK